MKKYYYHPLALLFLFLLPDLAFPQAVKVDVRKGPNGWSLFRDNKPYYIKGAGGKIHIDQLKFLGGNSIRTWGIDEADEALEIAAKNDLTVMLGLWVQHERHGFDYNDEEAVKKQLENFTAVVKKYKDHPNLLLWGVGNEVDLFYTNTKVWDAVQDICAMIHELDPNHPTATVTAGLDSNEVQEILTRAPDIDIYGVNTYGEINIVPEGIRNFGWDGPYLIAEWGPTGHWEVDKTDWGSPIEQTSTEKAASYKKRYADYIESYKGESVGSYVFLWGQKQETTSTWYGLFTEDGHPTEPQDELYKAWRKEDPPNFTPTITNFTLDGKTMNQSVQLKSGDNYEAVIEYKDPDGDPVKVKWNIYPESADTKSGGDFENSLQPILGVFTKRNKTSAAFNTPEKEGAYRLFVSIADGGKKTAYANIPFYVYPRSADDPPPKAVRLKPQVIDVRH